MIKLLYAVVIVMVLSVPAFADDTPVVAYQDRITAEKWNDMQQKIGYLEDKITLLEMKIIQLQMQIDLLKRSGWFVVDAIPCGREQE